MRKFFLLLLMPAAAFAAQPMSVDQAVAAAIKNNANAQNARLEVEKGQARVFEQKTHRYPQIKTDAYGSESLNRLSFDFKEGVFGTYPGTGPIPNKDTHINLARTFNTFVLTQASQPLTQLHKINLGIRMSEAALAADKESERAARQAIAREVKAAYFQVLTAKSYAEAAKEAVGVYDEVNREMTVRVSQKSALEADRMDAAARLAGARATLLSAENNLASAQDQLNYLVGADVDVLAQAGVAEQPAPATIDQRPDVRKAELQVEAAQLDAKLKADDRIPDVSIAVSHATPIHFDVLPQNLTTASLVVSWEPFTWGRRSAEIAEKRLAAAQAENALRDRRAAAQVEVAARRRKMEEAAAQIEVRQLEYEATRERLRVTRARFIERAARPDEMYSASAALSQAAARNQEAISAYWTARADYEKAIGEE